MSVREPVPRLQPVFSRGQSLSIVSESTHAPVNFGVQSFLMRNAGLRLSSGLSQGWLSVSIPGGLPRDTPTTRPLHSALSTTPIIRNCTISCSQEVSPPTVTEFDESGSGDPCGGGCRLARRPCEFLGRSGLGLFIFSHLALNGFFCLFNTGSHKTQAGLRHTILLPQPSKCGITV